jgi:YggT family protein
MQERRVVEHPAAADRTVDAPADGYVDSRTERVHAPAGQVVTRSQYETAPPPASGFGADVDQVQATAYDPYAERRRSSYRLVQGVWLLFGIVEGLLAIRFVLKLLGANETAGFASFIYGASAPFIAPFADLFANPASGGSILELTTIVAFVVYMLLAWLIAKVIWLLAGESRSATRTVANSTRTRVD